MQAPDENTLQLHDIHLPDPAGWWPPAPGWWILALLLIVLVVWLSRIAWQWLKYQQWRKRVLNEFSHFESIDDVQFLTQITEKLRQLAITVYPEREVASLTGKHWLEFLDRHSEQKDFSEHPANLMIEAPYTGQQVDLSSQQNRQLIQLARHWAKHNTRRDNYRRLMQKGVH